MLDELVDLLGVLVGGLVEILLSPADLILAQRGYQMNIASLDRVRASYQAAIQMGRG